AEPQVAGGQPRSATCGAAGRRGPTSIRDLRSRGHASEAAPARFLTPRIGPMPPRSATDAAGGAPARHRRAGDGGAGGPPRPRRDTRSAVRRGDPTSIGDFRRRKVGGADLEVDPAPLQGALPTRIAPAPRRT